jgi:serine/threonine protein phosphatase PrpC
MPPNHACSTDIGRRSIQQDEYCVAPLWEGKAHFFGVFDGHGSIFLLII